MKFNVSEILFQKAGFVSAVIIDEHTKIRCKDVFLFGKGQFLRTDKGIWFSADISTEIEMECGRCLNAFPFHVNFDIEEEVIPVDGPSNQRFVEGQNSGISLIDSNNILDISDMVGQYIDISVPINGNCDVQCKGLCMQCGINLNLNKCQCDVGPINEGWNILSSTRIIERKQETKIKMPPKKKHSKRRQRNKNANASINAPSIVQCKQCTASMQAHRACPECGYYNGRQVISVDQSE